MKIEISEENPFPTSKPHCLVWQYLKDNGPRGINLDYGAHDGKISSIFAESNLIDRSHCVDLNKEIVELSQSSLHSKVTLQHIEKNSRLPFADNFFDSITFLGVLEHIYDQESILKELYRVLKEGGILVILVPGKTIFSFLDMGNWKFIFPTLHKFYYVTRFSKEEYFQRYVVCKNGLIGDVEVEKRWHQHFTANELRLLLENNKFSSLYEDGRGLFFRLLVILNLVTFGLVNLMFKPLMELDSKVFSSDELMICCKK